MSYVFMLHVVLLLPVYREHSYLAVSIVDLAWDSQKTCKPYSMNTPFCCYAYSPACCTLVQHEISLL